MRNFKKWFGVVVALLGLAGSAFTIAGVVQDSSKVKEFWLSGWQGKLGVIAIFATPVALVGLIIRSFQK